MGVIRTLAAALGMVASTASAQLDPPAWTRATAPFPIVGPISYVGSEGLAAYLIRTSAGAILIDGTMAENVPAIRRNIESLGVPIGQVKLILLTHAHFDHAAGLAGLKAASGAKVVTGAADRRATETGTPPGEVSYGVIRFPPVPVARGVRNGERVTLGDVTLTAVAMPGHTPGCTGWRMTAERLDILFPCSLTVAGNRLVGNRRYPGIVADFRRTFEAVARLRPDVVLPAHPEQADVLGRGRRGREAFVDRALWPAEVAKARAAFEAELAKQQAAAAQ